MNLGLIQVADCVNVPPPTDPRCEDPAFALANPEVCPTAPRLVIKPAVALVCQLRSVQFKATYIANGVETDVSNLVVFNSSNPSVAVIGALSGNATGLSAGDSSISASYQGAEAFAELTVLGDDCCASVKVAMMVAIDRTKSMSLAFSSNYPTKLDYAKAAAKEFIEGINETKDVIGLEQFTAVSTEVLSAPIADKDAVSALVDGIVQTQQLTTYFDAITAAILALDSITDADRKVLFLISEGEDTDTSYADDSNPIQALDDFKAAGGIVIVLGVRAHGRGYAILSAFATGGFFINAHSATEDISLTYINGLKGYVCAGNCTPAGDALIASGQQNYCEFANWAVKAGHVDLIGNGFLDLLPGNGLYVDLAGSIAPFKGKLLLREPLDVLADKTYSLALDMAGNQRVDDVPNSVQVKVFEVNTDGLVDPAAAPTITPNPGSTPLDELESYEYAYSYLNANGETDLSPSDVVENEFSDSSFTIEAPTDASASVCRFWRRFAGRWYLIAETSAVSPSYEDTRTNALMQAAIDDGTIDICEVEPLANTTGTPIIILDQVISINNYQQDFTTLTLAFTATHDTEVFISIQQTQTPAGGDTAGLLLGRVKFTNATDGETLFEDDFDGENVQYVPPACGLGTTYVQTGQDTNTLIFTGAGTSEVNGTYIKVGPEQWDRVGGDFTIIFNEGEDRWNLVNVGIVVQYTCAAGNFPLGPWEVGDLFADPPQTPVPTVAYATTMGYLSGYNCYGDACLDEPPAVQTEDPDPLSDIEQGYTPPQTFTSTKTACVSCPSGYVNSSVALQASVVESSRVPDWGFVTYSLNGGAAAVTGLEIVGGAGSNGGPQDFSLYGSLDGVTFTLLGEWTGYTWSPGLTLRFAVTNTTAYLYYKIVVDVWSGAFNPASPFTILPLKPFFTNGATQICSSATATSDVSQGAADAAALSAATVAAQAQLNCVAKYTATITYVARCPAGTYGTDVSKTRTAESFISQQDANDIATAQAQEAAEAELSCELSNNGQQIVINDRVGADPAKATPYGSAQFVEDQVGVISKVTVNLNGVSHNFPKDIQVVLRSPAGTVVGLFRNCGGNLAASDLDFVFDDAAGSQLAAYPGFGPGTALASGTYQISNHGVEAPLPSPGPAGPYGDLLSDFNGEDPNGAWSLWVIDTLAGGAGTIDSWSITLTLV